MAKVLVIEDDVNMNEILASTLEGMDHDVDAAFNGPQAVEMCKENDYELIVSDVRLPGIDGVETLEQVRKVLPKVKYIIITGYASADTPVKAIRQSIDDYLFKPFSLKYLTDSVNRVLSTPAERKSKWSLFQKAFSILGPSKDKELEKLVLQRHSAFQALYVGVRSDHLSLKAACEVYIKLELLEKKFRTLLNTPQPDSKEMRFVRELYSNLHQRLGDFKSGTAEEAPNEGVIPLNTFNTVYQAIKDSEIGVEELQYAPLLRLEPEERFETLKEMLEIKHKIWPSQN